MHTNRKAQVLRQSPGLIAKTDRAAGSYKTQLNSHVDKATEAEVYRALAAEPGDHAHHNIPIETLDKLFDGLSVDEQAELRNYINQHHGRAIGNHIRNLINIPGEIHQGGIHKYAREMGYEIDAKKNPIGLALEILEASTVPSIQYRKHIADKYMQEAVPAMNDHLNDLLTAHYASKQRMAGERINNELKAESMADSQGQVVGQKPIVINADEDAKVFVHTNGNGNGHTEMQKAFNQYK